MCSFQRWQARATVLLAAALLAGNGQAAQEPSDEEIMALFHPSIALAMGRLAAFSYCGNKLEPARVEQCAACERAGFKVVKDSVQPLFVPWYGNPQANFFILGQFARTDGKAKDIPSKGCFVVTRGSANPTNWISNFQIELVNPRWLHCPACRVHKGYHGVYHRALPHIQKYLDSHGCGLQDGDPIYITGHSMGGAVSSVMIGGLTELGYNVALSYVQEPPLTGNEAYRQYFMDHVASAHPPVPVIRLTNGKDTSPSFPDPTKGYRPLPYEFYSDPVWGTHRICRNTSEDCSAGVKHREMWAKKSLLLDHIIVWYAPHHMVTLSMMAPEWCKQNPNPVLMQLELTKVGFYVFFLEAGPWNAAIRCFVLVLFLGVAVALCLCCCRARWRAHRVRSREIYKRIS